MSVQGEIDRIKGNVAAAYAAVSAKGEALPETQNSENLPGAVESIPGPYIAGNGVSFEETEDGTAINLETPVQELTEAEYYALPEERKNHGLYFLPDAQPSGGGSGNSSMEVYDGEERVIGTWFGKPLYQKVIIETSAKTGNVADVSDLHIDTCIRSDMISRCTESYGLAFRVSGDVNTICALDITKTHVKVYASGATINEIFAIILQYTKTTDEAVSE